MNRKSATVVAAGFALTVASATACWPEKPPNGMAKKPPGEVLATTTSALKAARTVHVVGTRTDPSGKSATTIDIRFVNGRGAVGRFGKGARSVDVIRLGDDAYVRGARDIVGVRTAGPVDRYVRVPVAAPRIPSLEALTDLGTFADTLLTPEGSFAPTVDQSRVGDTEAVVLTDTDLKTGRAVYVADSGSPRPLRVVGSGANVRTNLTFSGYGNAVTLAAPANPLTAPPRNGEERKTTGDVVADTRNALKAARTVRVTTPGVDYDGTRLSFDLTYVKGKGAKGTITLGGRRLEFVRIGSTAYLKAGADAGAKVASDLPDRYMRMPVTDPDLKDFGNLTDVAKLADVMLSQNNVLDPLGPTRTSRLDGRPIVAVGEATGDEYDELDVANTGSPYLLRMVEGSRRQTVRFSEYDQEVRLAAPTDFVDKP